MLWQTVFAVVFIISLTEAHFDFASYLRTLSRQHTRRSETKEERSSSKQYADLCKSGFDLQKDGTVNIDIRFDKVHIDRDDSYMCTAYKVPYDGADSYITQYIPHASMKASHHMLVYGCDEPGVTDKKVWNCGGMGKICNGKSKVILFAWARDAPPLTLPRDIGYRVGKKAGILYLIVQIHYAHKLPKNDYDCSGISMMATQEKQKHYAGVFLLGSPFISIPPHSKFSKADVSCSNPASSTIHVFAFRTHAHQLAKVITGYRVRNKSVDMIGKGNPQWPHSFYPRIGGSMELLPGDGLLARCTYASNRSKYTVAGMGGSDEMCNFYMMYFSDTPPQSELMCWGNDLPNAEELFPGTANDLAPYPGYAGQVSTDAIASGEAVMPKIPGEHHHHHEQPSDESPPQTGFSNIIPHAKTVEPSISLPSPQVVTVTPEKTEGQEQNYPELTADLNWPEASVSSVIGQVGGVAVDKNGRLHVFHRANRIWGQHSFIPFTDKFAFPDSPITKDTVLILDQQEGSVTHQWGKNLFFMPHGISIDDWDNVWLTDVAMHQVFKFPLHGGNAPLLTLGVKMIPGSDNEHFCKPTDIAVDREGSVYVADGYCNGRVMKFSAEGKLIKSWGERSTSFEDSPPPFYFNVIHSLAITGENEICAADRENGRVQCFGFDGGFRRMIEHRDAMGRNVYAISYSKQYGGLLYAVNGLPSEGGMTAGFTMRAKTGSIINQWTPSPVTSLSRPHDVAVSPDGKDVYVGQLSKKKIYKFSVKSDEEPPVSINPLPVEVKGSNNNLSNNKEEKNSQESVGKDEDDDERNIYKSNETPAHGKDDIKSNEIINYVEEPLSSKQWSIPIIFLLVAIPVVAIVIGCIMVRSRKRRFKEYQDLLSHDEYDVYEENNPTYLEKKGFNIGTFLTQSKQGKHGFEPLANAVDDVTESEDELFTKTSK